MKIYIIVAINFLSVLFAASARSQSTKLPLTLSVYSQSLGIPRFRNAYKINGYGFRAATEWYYSKTKHLEIFQSAGVSIAEHRIYDRYLNVLTQAGVRAIVSNWQAELRLGGGYQASRLKSEVFRLSDGIYKSTGKMIHKLMGIGSFGIGYQLRHCTFILGTSLSVENHYLYFESPYMPRQSFEAGIRKAFHL